MGWIGPSSQFKYVLQVMGADRDEKGNFIVAGSIFSFLGLGEEIVVGDDAEYFVGGKPVNLAGALAATSYGVSGIRVIG